MEKTMSKAENKNDKASSDFVIGLVTFITFVVFMSIWMVFASSK